MKRIVKTISSTLYRVSITKKLLISYIVLFLIPIIVFAILSNQYLSKTLRQQFQTASDSTLKQINSNLQNLLTDVIETSEQIAYNNILSDLYEQGEHSGIVSSFKKFTTATNVVSNSIRDNRIYSVEVFTEGAYVLDERSVEHGCSFVDINSTYAQGLDAALKEIRGGLMWFEPQIATRTSTGEEFTLITGAQYIKSTKTHRNIGIVATNIEQSLLDAIVGDSTITENSVTLLISDLGTVIAVSDEEKFINAAILAEDIPLFFDSNDSIIYNQKHERFLIDCVTVNNTNWCLLSLNPYIEVMKFNNQTRNYFLLLLAITSFLFLILAFFFSQLFAKNIQVLTKHIQHLQFDNYTPIPYTHTSSELDALIENYNHLLNKVNDYAHEQYLLGVELKNAELKALQAQINPHFLYNTLDLLHWMAIDYNATEIEKIVSLLSKFYKLSLSKGKDVIPVGDAIQHIDVYVQLLNHRFGNTITLECNLQPEIFKYQILNLLLQPIVENAIIHGIQEKSVPKGTVTIEGSIQDGKLFFRIIDDGVGMSDEQIKNLSVDLDTSLDAPNHADGYGVKNVMSRIKLYYGNDYGLSYSNANHNGTCATIVLPANPIHQPY